MNLSIFASEYCKTNTSKRSLLNGSAAVVGLSAGALGWSGLAQASGDEARLQTVLLPDHYSLQEDGVVVFSLTTGEQMTLSEDQYVILEDGLLLVTDELAQNAVTQLPVMGVMRTQLLNEIQPVSSPDGSIVEASSAKPLWSGEGDAPRLFEQIDMQRYDIAQSNDTDDLDSGLLLAGGAGGLVLLSMLQSGDQPETETEVREYLRNWDIDPGSSSSNAPDEPVVFNGVLYFAADDGTNGSELWKYDGVNPPSLADDILAGSAGSYPSDFTVYDGKLYFEAETDDDDELWVFDGTTASLAADTNRPDELAVYDGALYFRATGALGRELWKFDGTTASLAADINAGSDSSDPQELTVYDGILYFRANGVEGRFDQELWKFDGATASQVADIRAGSSGSNPSDFTVFNDVLYFAAEDDAHGEELWTYDGVNPPSLAADINSGSDSSNPSNLTVFNDALYFAAKDDAHGEELWTYDGVNPPSLVADLNPGDDRGVRLSDKNILTVYNGALYFEGNDGVNGQEVWNYDGTTLSRVTDINPGSDNSDIKDMIAFQGAIYFHADNGTDGDEMWAYNADGWVV